MASPPSLTGSSSYLQTSMPASDYQSALSQGSVSSLSGIAPPNGPRLVQTNQTTFNAVAANLDAIQLARASQETDRSLGTTNRYNVKRLPWIFATFEDVRGISTPLQAMSGINAGFTLGDNAIVWTTNPKSVNWQISQRGSEAKNKSGTVLHMYRDKTRKSDFDDAKINFQFQSGSIIPINDNVSDPNAFAQDQVPNLIAPGLSDFYKFIQLVDQPKITLDGVANVIHVLYRSRIFPSLTLTGFFDPQVVVQFTDDSQNPHMISSWSANFTVYSTTPKLNGSAFRNLQAAFAADDGTGSGFTGF